MDSRLDRQYAPQRLFGIGRLLAMAMFMASCHTVTQQPSPPEYEFSDLTGNFTRFWDRTQALNERERVAAFKEEFGAMLPDFYGPSHYEGLPPERRDARIQRALEGFPSIRKKYTRIAASFQTMMAPAIASFRRVFPDAQMTTPVYLLHSLGEMDGGTRTFGDRVVLVFGADAMASVHDFEGEEPFLHHELFHVYHQSYFPECSQVWCYLWMEGLAVYASQQLNPHASDSQLLLTKPEPIRPQVEAHLNDAICTVLAKLDSSEDQDISALFSFERLSPALPPRAGYYIGYLAARKLGATRPIIELARLSSEEVRSLLEQALDELQKCEPSG